MEEFESINDEYCLVKIIKKTNASSLIEMKEKCSNDMKYVKIYYRGKINLTNVNNFVEYLEKERVLRINHILLYDKYIIDDKYIILIMKKYENNLEELLKKKEMNENEINGIMLKLSETIKILQENGMIYNNIKVNNILFDENGEMMIVDNLKYILLKDMKNELKRDAEEIMISSPEFLKDEEISKKSDIWNIGVVYYQLLIKEFPFKTNSIYDLIKSITEYKYDNNSKINDEYNNILSRLLTVKKENRMSIDELIELIKNIIFEVKLKEVKELMKNNEKAKAVEIVDNLDRTISFKEKYRMNEIMGDCLYENKEYIEAIPYYKTAFDYSPSNEDKSYCYYSIGYCYMELKEYKEAILYHKRSLLYSSSNRIISNNNNNIGYCYYNLKHFEDSLKYYEKALEYSSSNEDLELSNRMIGNCYYQMKEYFEAIPYYEKASSFAQTEYFKDLNLIIVGKSYLKLKEYEKSLSYVNQINLDVCDNWQKFYYYKIMGEYYLFKNEKEDGKKYLETALEFGKELNYEEECEDKKEIMKIINEL